MRATKLSRTGDGTRRAWEPPVVTKLALATQTKSGGEDERGAAAQPRPPAAPSTKLGFSFEMAFPLSARTGE